MISDIFTAASFIVGALIIGFFPSIGYIFIAVIFAILAFLFIFRSVFLVKIPDTNGIIKRIIGEPINFKDSDNKINTGMVIRYCTMFFLLLVFLIIASLQKFAMV